ncbi:IclR family transcriptional regulator [Streptomyces flaveolus]|uniref:IclR family transcriptional regulator n=1 Tax=Streptomyces flaveolus TaxID=67297 RepID=UPI0033D5B89E
MVPSISTRQDGRGAGGESLISRAFTLLEVFRQNRRSVTLSELSRFSGIPVSSTLRLARQLMAVGALDRDEDGHFTIGQRLWEIASLAPGPSTLTEIALPYMRDLSAGGRQHVVLAAPVGHEALMLERLSPSRLFPPLYRKGSRLPLFSTGVGRVLLAHAPHEVEAALLTRPLVVEPEHELLDAGLFRRDLALVRRTDMAAVTRSAGLRTLAVAVPVREPHGTVVAALGVVLSLPDDVFAAPPAVVRSLRSAATAISEALTFGAAN